MEYRITGFPIEHKYLKIEALYWIAEDKNGKTVAAARLDGKDRNYSNLTINYSDRKPKEELLELLLKEVFAFANNKIKRIDIQILDIMKELKEVLEKNSFNEIYKAEYSEGITAIRYCKIFD